MKNFVIIIALLLSTSCIHNPSNNNRININTPDRDIYVFRIKYWPAENGDPPIQTALALIKHKLYYYAEDTSLVYKPIALAKSKLINDSTFSTFLQSLDSNKLNLIQGKKCSCKAQTMNVFVIRIKSKSNTTEYIANERSDCDKNSPCIILQKFGDEFEKFDKDRY